MKVGVRRKREEEEERRKEGGEGTRGVEREKEWEIEGFRRILSLSPSEKKYI